MSKTLRGLAFLSPPLATSFHEYIEFVYYRAPTSTQKGGVVQGAAVAGLAEAVEVMRGSSATVDENYECASEVYRVISE